MPEDPAMTRPHARATRVGPSTTRLTLAFLVAAASDVVSYGTVFAPPVQWGVDVVTAVLLFGLLGWRWALLPGFVAEAIPGVAVFPVWVLVVTSVALWGGIQRTTPRPGRGARPRRGSQTGGPRSTASPRQVHALPSGARCALCGTAHRPLDVVGHQGV